MHRPVQMKKSEIKRRKRVVPAIRDQNLVAQMADQYQNGTDELNTSMHSIGQHEDSEHHMHASQTDIDPPSGTRSAAPMPVDFTQYTMHHESQANGEHAETGPIGTSRKRSFSHIQGADIAPVAPMHSRASANVNGSKVSNIDPLLSTQQVRQISEHQPDHVHRQAANSASAQRSARRRQLEMDMAKMREQMLRQEEELAAMDAEEEAHEHRDGHTISAHDGVLQAT